MAEAYDVQVRLDGRWLEVPLQADETDVDAWASQAVADAAAARRLAPSPDHRRIYEQTYAAVLEHLLAPREDDEQLLGAYCLLPDDDVLYTATVELSAVSLAFGMSVDDVVQVLVAPESQRYGPPGVDELATGYGACVRVRQLLLTDDAGDDSELIPSLVYMWPTEDDGIFLALSASFASAVDAAVHEGVVDELAQSLTLRPVA